MASLGHSAMQAPQPVQVSASIFATCSTVMASTGQAWTHIPQPVHLLSSIFTAIDTDPSFKSVVLFKKRKILKFKAFPFNCSISFLRE
jgi:hypothetical protein